jgi:hypothetical protein
MIMTRLISLFLISGLAKELAVTNVTVLFSPADPLRFTLRLNQEHIVATYPNHESTISLTVRNKDRSQRYTESYCYS